MVVNSHGTVLRDDPSMKVPPKRKGNPRRQMDTFDYTITLNESPSEKEGKFLLIPAATHREEALNESPSEKEGKFFVTPHAPSQSGFPQ